MDLEYYREKWRLRTVINTEADIENMQFKYDDITVRIVYTVDSENKPQAHLKTLDLMVDKKKKRDIKEAYYFLKDQTSKVMDYLSFITYSGFIIQEELGISQDGAKENDEYDVYVNIASLNRKIKKTTMSTLQLDKFITDDNYSHWLSLLRSAYNSLSEFEKFIYYYSLLESIARNQGNETIKNKIKCELCKETYEKDTGRKATNGYVKKALKDVGATKQQIKYATELRGKYAHGNGKRDSFLKSTTLEVLPFIEEACLVQLGNLTGLKIYNCVNTKLAGFPLVRVSFKQDKGDSATFLNADANFPVKFIDLVTYDIGIHNNITTNFGVETIPSGQMPKINYNALPHYIE